MSYVVLSGVGLMPLQLLNLGTIGSLAFYRAFYTRTPRDFAELNAPPSLNYGTGKTLRSLLSARTDATLSRALTSCRYLLRQSTLKPS